MPQIAPPERRPVGRPRGSKLKTEENAERIVSTIEEVGMSPSAAGALWGVHRQIVSEWIQEDESFADSIARAKSSWQLKTLRKLQSDEDCANARELSWLLSKQLSREYGEKITHEMTGQIAHLLVTPEQLQQLQERKRALSLPEKESQ